MILNKKWKLLIFSIIVLIVSITPASAIEIGQVNGNNSTTGNDKPFWLRDLVNEWTGHNNTVYDSDEIEFHQYQIDLLTDEINKDTDQINELVGEIKYDAKHLKFFKLIEKAKEIKKISNDIETKSEILDNVTNELNDLLKNLGSNLEVDGDYYINNADNPNCEKDACNMADELTHRENTTFTAKDVNASELKKGDIVQYLSQDKYPRYLVVQDIKTGNNTEGQILGTSVDIPIGYLECTGDKLVEVALVGTFIKLVPTTGVDTENTLNDIVQIQQGNIDKTKKDAEKTQTRANRVYYSYDLLYDLAVICDLTGGILLAAGFVSIVLCPPAAPELIVWGGVIVAVGVGLGFVCITLLAIDNNINDNADKLENSAKFNQEDLNTYTYIEPRIPYNMNITTFDGIPVVKQPPVNDWRDLQFILVKSPEHGDLLSGPGLQFLYGPREGYTGQDHFEFEFRGKDGKMGFVTVDILVDPIPLFKVPSEA